MNASDRRRLYTRAGILMVTRNMDPARATIEAATQLRMMRGNTTRQGHEPTQAKGRDDLRIAVERLIGGGPASDLAEEILAWIRRRKLSRFTKRDLHRHLRRQVADLKEWDVPLDLLVELGWIREVPGDGQPKSGRPSREYGVNPAMLVVRDSAIEAIIAGTSAPTLTE